MGNVNALRAMRLALTATDTMVGLPDCLHSAVVTYQVAPLEPLEMLLLATLGDITGIHRVIVMAENGRNVNAIRTWHAISTACARNGRVVLHQVRHLLKKCNLLLGKRLEVAESLHVLYKRIHRRHAAQNRKHTWV